MAGTTSSAEDHVEFSNTMGSLARAVSSDQTGRASRIQALAAQVQNGTYQPSAQAISRGMISEALAGGTSN
jgi:anti-sigma28 factor (negative regulator of flagellin synthesis)